MPKKKKHWVPIHYYLTVPFHEDIKVTISIDGVHLKALRLRVESSSYFICNLLCCHFRLSIQTSVMFTFMVRWLIVSSVWLTAKTKTTEILIRKLLFSYNTAFIAHSKVTLQSFINQRCHIYPLMTTLFVLRRRWLLDKA